MSVFKGFRDGKGGKLRVYEISQFSLLGYARYYGRIMMSRSSVFRNMFYLSIRLSVNASVGGL